MRAPRVTSAPSLQRRCRSRSAAEGQEEQDRGQVDPVVERQPSGRHGRAPALRGAPQQLAHGGEGGAGDPAPGRRGVGERQRVPERPPQVQHVGPGGEQGAGRSQEGRPRRPEVAGLPAALRPPLEQEHGGDHHPDETGEAGAEGRQGGQGPIPPAGEVQRADRPQQEQRLAVDGRAEERSREDQQVPDGSLGHCRPELLGDQPVEHDRGAQQGEVGDQQSGHEGVPRHRGQRADQERQQGEERHRGQAGPVGAVALLGDAEVEAGVPAAAEDVEQDVVQDGCGRGAAGGCRRSTARPGRPPPGCRLGRGRMRTAGP